MVYGKRLAMADETSRDRVNVFNKNRLFKT
jgi:hypothetical protein